MLKQFPSGQGKRTDIQHLDGDDEKLTRKKAASEAGLSDRQYRTAMDVGHVPEQQFETQVKSDNPPTVTALAKQGRATRTPAMADRLQARAIRRCGELMKQIEPQRGKDWESKRDGTVPITRESAATDARLSERQRKTALRVAIYR